MKRTGTETSSFGTSGRVNHDAEKFYSSRLYEELADQAPVSKEVNDFPAELLNKNIHGSAESMSQLPDSCLHLMVTSPPYNASKEYDEDLSLDEYLQMLKRVFAETYRVLVNGGRACVNVANLGRKPYIPLSDHVSRMMIDLGFNMRGEIIWDKAASASASTAWGSWKSASNPTLRDVHEYILVFSKGDYKRERGGGDEKSGADTIAKEDFIEWTKSIWTFNAESAKKIGHPAPFPIDLPHRLIQLFSFTGDIVLDPFMGSGTTAIAALMGNRNFVGYEVSAEYIDLAEKRLAQHRNTLDLG